MSPAAREAVERAIAKLGYSPNQAARSLVTRRTDAIALVVAEPEARFFSDPFFSGGGARGGQRGRRARQEPAAARPAGRAGARPRAALPAARARRRRAADVAARRRSAAAPARAGRGADGADRAAARALGVPVRGRRQPRRGARGGRASDRARAPHDRDDRRARRTCAPGSTGSTATATRSRARGCRVRKGLVGGGRLLRGERPPRDDAGCSRAGPTSTPCSRRRT